MANFWSIKQPDLDILKMSRSNDQYYIFQILEAKKDLVF